MIVKSINNQIRNTDTMKKKICYLLALSAFIAMSDVSAQEPLVKINERGYETGAFNKMEIQQVNGYQLEKSYIHSLDHVSKDEQIYDAGVEENIAREGVLYNPHFLLEKIVFEGNTQISDEDIDRILNEL